MERYLAVDFGSLYGSPFGQTKGLSDLISLIINGAFAIAGLGVIILILFAGISMIAGAGKNDADATAKGQKAATAALIGALIVFFAYFIVRLIELIFGVAIVSTAFVAVPNVI